MTDKPADKYKILKELISEWIDRENENMKEARPTGVNCPAFCMAMGARDAYAQVLSDIKELESMAVICD